MKKIIFLFLLSFFVISCGNDNINDYKKNVSVELIKSDEYKEEITLIGYTIPIQETDISTKISGRIAEINVNVGDTVKKGDLLVKLYPDENAINMESSIISENDMKEIIEGQKIFFEQQIINAQKVLDIAVANFNAIKTNYTNTVITADEQRVLARKNYDQSLVALENTKMLADQRLKTVYKNAKVALRNAIIISVSANDFMDNIIGVSDSKKNINTSGLGNLNSSTFIQAKNDLLNSMKYKNDFYNLYKNNIENNDINKSDAILYLNTALNVLEKTLISLKSTHKMLENSVAIAYTESELNNMKNQIIDLGNQINLSILNVSGNTKLGVYGILLTIDEINIQNQAEIKASQSMVDIAKANVDQIVAVSNQGVSNISSQEKIAYEQVEQAKAVLKSVQISKENTLKDLNLKLNQIQNQKKISKNILDQTSIYASFDGVITKKYLDIGAVVNPGVPILHLADISIIKVRSDLVNNDYINISNQQKINNKDVFVYVDNISEYFNPNDIKISPNVNDITKVPYIDFFIDNANNQIKIGVFTKVIIQLNPKKGIKLSNKAIVSEYGSNFVFLISTGEVVVKKPVDIIYKSDDFVIVDNIDKNYSFVVVSGQKGLRNGDKVLFKNDI